MRYMIDIYRNITNLKYFFLQPKEKWVRQFTSRNIQIQLFGTNPGIEHFKNLLESLKKEGMKLDKLAAKKRSIEKAAGNGCFFRIWADVFKASRLREADRDQGPPKVKTVRVSPQSRVQEVGGLRLSQGSKVSLHFS